MATAIPPNAAPFSLAEVVRATAGQVLQAGSGQAAGVVTDSRADVAGKLFVALSGERFDGHEYVPAALERGAVGALVSCDVPVTGDAFVVRVPCTLTALGALARFHRQRWGGTVVAIGGSAGKTTTRSAVSALLGAVLPGAVHFARGNLNNQVGLPMVLFGVQPDHRVVVLEVGTNVSGEVAKLAGICQPDVAVLTLVALEHSEGLGGLDGIEIEEGSLLAAVGAAGTAIANGDDRRARRQLERSPAATHISYGRGAACEYRLVRRELCGLGAGRLEVERPGPNGRETLHIEVGMMGDPGALAALAALGVADRLAGAPVDAALVSRALAPADALEAGRLCPLLLGDGTLVIDDTYNANPVSVLSSVATAQELARSREARLFLVIGEMRELGECSSDEHARVGAELGRCGAAGLVAIGGDAERLVEPARAGGVDAEFAADADAALTRVLARVVAGDVVLVKASRGVRAERVVAGLREAKGAAA